MALVKLNNNGVKNATAFGSITGLGSMVFIKKLTASSSGTLSFVNGASGVVLNNTYKEYLFTFKNIHGSTNDASFSVNFRDGGTAYDAVKTSAGFRAYHFESDSGAGLGYEGNLSLAQSSAFNLVGQQQSANQNDSSGSGQLSLYNPSSTTFVKHFISHYSHHYTSASPGVIDNYVGGYCNTTTAIDGVQFKMNSGNIATGDICLYGIA